MIIGYVKRRKAFMHHQIHGKWVKSDCDTDLYIVEHNSVYRSRCVPIIIVEEGSHLYVWDKATTKGSYGNALMRRVLEHIGMSVETIADRDTMLVLSQYGMTGVVMEAEYTAGEAKKVPMRNYSIAEWVDRENMQKQKALMGGQTITLGG